MAAASDEATMQQLAAIQKEVRMHHCVNEIKTQGD